MIMIIFFFSSVVLVLYLPELAEDLHRKNPTSQWLQNLDSDMSTSEVTPATPTSAQPTKVSTPALPEGIKDFIGSVKPQNFEPDHWEETQLIRNGIYVRWCTVSRSVGTGEPHCVVVGFR